MNRDQQHDRSRAVTRGRTRRSYVRTLGVLGAGIGLTAGNVSAQADEDVVTISDLDEGEYCMQLEPDGADSAPDVSVINVREDLGVEPEEDDVWSAIYDHYQSFRPTERRHRYVLPSGTWHVETDNNYFDAHEYLAIVGEPHATLKVTDQSVDRLMTVGTIEQSLPNAQRTVMKDLEVEILGDYDAGICRWYTHMYGYLENVSMRGRRDRRNSTYGGDRHTILVNGRYSDTTNIVRNCHLTNGDTPSDQTSHVGYAIPFSAEPYHVGTNIWEGCHVDGYIDNGIYVSSSPGMNTITSCHVRNNGGSSIRIGDNDHVQNCRITVTEYPEFPWSGLWLEMGSGQVVEQVRIEVDGVDKEPEIVRLTQDGAAQLSNVHIIDEGEYGRAIRVSDNDETRTLFDSCTITDRSSPETSDYAVYVRSSNVTFRDCEFDLESQTSQDRHGIYLFRSGTNVDELTLDNCDVDADGASLRFAESGQGHTVTNTTFEDLVLSDADTTLRDVLWSGNRHYGPTNFAGTQLNWQGSNNFGYDL